VVARATDLMSDEHFTVDGTLLEAWASQKSSNGKTAAPMAMGGTSTARSRRTTRTPRRRIRTRGSIGNRTTAGHRPAGASPRLSGARDSGRPFTPAHRAETRTLVFAPFTLSARNELSPMSGRSGQLDRLQNTTLPSSDMNNGKL
jgi:hypothetical protein